MKRCLAVGLSIAALCRAIAPISSSARASTKLNAASPIVAENYGKLPLSFEANQGQIDSQVKFLSRGNGYSLFLTDSAAVLELSKTPLSRSNTNAPRNPFAARPVATAAMETDVVRMELAGAAHDLQITGSDQLPGISNYFAGRDPTNWHTSVPTFAKVKYTGVYPGIDLVYYGDQKQLEYDFVVAPNADARPIRLHFSGANKLTLNKSGDLTVAARNGEIAFHQPVIYQESNGRREAVAGHFILLANDTVGFHLGNYDHTRTLVIDPVLAYSTYLGGPETLTTAMAVDETGNVYVTGMAYFSLNSLAFPFPTTSNALDRSASDQSFISKLDPSGSVLIYSTFLSGASIYAIAVNKSGNAYITGYGADSLPTTPGAYQTENNGGPQDPKAFVTELNPAGSGLVYSTRLGGTGNSIGLAIAVDSAGNAYIGGETRTSSGTAIQSDFPTTPGAFQTHDHQTRCCENYTDFVAKLSATGSNLLASTYLGGEYRESVSGMAVDSGGSVYISGPTDSANFPVTPGAFVTDAALGYSGFIAKLKPDFSALAYSTYFNNGPIGLDASGNIYIAPAFNVAGAPGPPVTSGAFRSAGGGYVGKLNPSGSALVYGTYLGGTGRITSLAVDGQGHAFVTGISAGGLPTTPDAIQPVNNAATLGLFNAILAEVNTDGTALLYASYFGGSGIMATYCSCGDFGSAIALDHLGNAYLFGAEVSADFPVSSGAFQTANQTFNGMQSGFVAKFAFHGATTTSLTTDNVSQPIGTAVIFKASAASVDGSTVPTGHMRFLIDGAFGPLVALDSMGQATYSTNSLPAGVHLVTADYLGSPTQSASSATLTQTITGGQVSIPVLSELSGIYTPSIMVSISTPTPGAAIHYTTDGTVPNVNSAAYSVPFNVGKTETVRAIALLSGSTPSTIAAATYTISSTTYRYVTIAVQSAINPSAEGQSVTFTATVTPNMRSGPITGSVAFLNGNVVIGTAPVLNGVATFSYSGLTLNGHDITADYLGTATYAGCGSPVLRQIVHP